MQPRIIFAALITSLLLGGLFFYQSKSVQNQNPDPQSNIESSNTLGISPTTTISSESETAVASSAMSEAETLETDLAEIDQKMQQMKQVKNAVDEELQKSLEIIQRTSRTQAFQAVQELIKKIKDLRKSNIEQTIEDELYLNRLTDILLQLPSESAFEKTKCESYRGQLILTFDPSVEEEANDPALQAGLKILETFCK